MTAEQLHAALATIIASGQGHRAVAIYHVEQGVTFKQDVLRCEEADEHDGDLVWLFVGDLDPPEWAGGRGWTKPR